MKNLNNKIIINWNNEKKCICLKYIKQRKGAVICFCCCKK